MEVDEAGGEGPAAVDMGQAEDVRPRATTVVIIGAGPSGIGMAALLKQCRVDCIVLERGRIGETFHRWPRESRFISPSFTGNFFNAPDLNAITPDSSPAFGLQAEHPDGPSFAGVYLSDVKDHFELDVRTGCNVVGIDEEEDGTFIFDTSHGEFSSRFLVWAGGEAQFPKRIPGTVRVQGAYADFPVGRHVVVGGGESGMEAAYNLVANGSTVTVFDPSALWAKRTSDSSLGLSPYTHDRVRAMQTTGRVELVPERLSEIAATYVVSPSRGRIELTHPAIDCTGFDITQSLAGDLFEFVDNEPLLTPADESTFRPNVFLVGPHVQHGRAVFCFVYKYRQRFAIVAREMLRRLGRSDADTTILEYKRKGFWLEDLSCCADLCAC